MNPSTAKELLPIITAYAAGKPIQLRIFGPKGDISWEDTLYPDFSCRVEDYRIKPEPFSFYGVVYTDPDGHRRWSNLIGALSTLEEAERAVAGGILPNGEVVKVREVQDAQ